VLLGSTNLADYATTVRGAIEAPAFNRCLIYAYRAKNIGFTGKGLVDARGTPAAFPVKSGKQLGERPMLMRFVECENVSFKDLSFKNPASWGLHMVSCRNLHFEGIRMESKHNNTNNDGIDLDGCVDVLVEDCVIKSGDDAICLKSTTSQPCSNIVVRGCELSSDTAAVKLGTSSSVLYARHVSGLTVRNLEATFDKPDVRRPICLEDVEGMEQTGVVVH
jgi:polygalacturonase